LIFLFLIIPCRARIIYVDADANGADDGRSWADAYNYLQDAIADANSSIDVNQVWVAEGIYGPDQNSADPKGSSDRTATFQLVSGVTIKGGYAGFGQPDPNARDVDAYETILSGDLNGDDGPNFTGNGDNSYHVVTGNGTDDTAVLGGFTITGGNANGPAPSDRGGGMSNEWGGPTVTDCTFSLNSASNCGAGMYNYFSGVIAISGCGFRDNSAGYDGGAIFNWISEPILTNVVFSGNTAGGNGGGMFTNHGYGTLSNCTFSENSADVYGGGIYNAKLYGEVVLTNCIFWGNVAEEGPQIGLSEPVMGGAETFVSYSDIQGGQLDVYDPGEMLRWGNGNIDADPCFADEAGGDYHLQSTAGRWDPNSETWVSDGNTSLCIDAGNPGCDPGDEPAPNGNRINMGAYGGTAEASKSPPGWALLADVTNDRKVDSNDLKILTYYWLESGACLPSDFSRDQLVNFADFAILALEWSGQIQTTPGIEYETGECDMNPQDADSGEPNFSVWVEGRYIHFEDMIYANCCPDQIELEMTVDGNLITIHEIETTTSPCRCMCYFPVTATLGPFANGTYSVEVFDNYGQSLGTAQVVIGGSGEPGLTYQIDDCNQGASASLVVEPAEQARFTVTVEGQHIHFEDMMVANCCPDKLELEMTVEASLITIYEIETTTGGCRCICDFPVAATLGPFEPGTYALEVYQDYDVFIGSTTVVIGPGP
jgi:predicted outer membrane repeat protein